MQIEIFTDGSSLGNPGPGGFCALIKKGTSTIIARGGAEHTTNNRMELAAMIAGLYTLHKKFPEVTECSIISDSNLLIQTLNKGWKRKKNLDLWEKMDKIRAHYKKITYKWVRGHNGHPENTEADRIAYGEAKKHQKKLATK